MGRNVLPAMVLAVAVGCSGRSGVTDKDDARAIIEKAIKAQGGEEKLAPFKAGRWKGKGTMTMQGRTIPVTMELVYELPDKYKSNMQFEVQGRKIEVLQVMEGEKGWM